MKVTHIQLNTWSPTEHTNHVTFAIKNPKRSDPYILKAATGLDADEIIKVYNDGPLFFRTRPKQRTVVFAIRMNPSYTGGDDLSDLRDKIYKAIAYNTAASTFNSDSKLEIAFFNESTYLGSLWGFITKIETSIFGDTPDLNLTIDCEDPFIKTVELTSMMDGVDLTPDGASHIYNGVTYLVGSSVTHNDTKSTAPHGFELEVECVDDITSVPPRIILWDNRNPSIYIFSAQFDFVIGDKVQFSSEEDNRHINVIRDDIIIASLMQNIYWGSIWPYLYPGNNKIEVSEGFHIIGAQHRATYWGV